MGGCALPTNTGLKKVLIVADSDDIAQKIFNLVQPDNTETNVSISLNIDNFIINKLALADYDRWIHYFHHVDCVCFGFQGTAKESDDLVRHVLAHPDCNDSIKVQFFHDAGLENADVVTTFQEVVVRLAF